MTDQLSTSDLAARSDRDDADSTLETEERVEYTTNAGATGDQEPASQSSQADASLSRDPGADQPQVDSRAAQGGQLPGSDAGEVATQRSSGGTDQEAAGQVATRLPRSCGVA
jgi:hypothetical protein